MVRGCGVTYLLLEADCRPLHVAALLDALRMSLSLRYAMSSVSTAFKVHYNQKLG